jgi:DNA primase
VNRDEAKECIKNNYRFYFEQHLSEYEKSKKGYPLCPKCKEHEIQPMKEKEGYYKCFKCGAYGDVLDYIRLEYGLKNFKEQMDKAIKLYKITIDKKSKIKGTKNLYMEPKQDIDIKNKQKASYTKYYEKISKNIDTTNYLLNRGISLKVQEEFGIRFDPKWTHPNDSYKTTQSMIIIPTGTDNTSYIARSIDIDSKEDHIYKVENSLFNSVALKSDKYNPIPVFITEGEIDALSILECKFKAVGLSSTVNKNLLISKLENMLSNEQCIPQLILYLDNDPSGKEASENLEKKLEALKIPCTNFYKLIEEHKKEYKNDRNYKEESEYLETLLKTKDPNDALNNNKDKFEQALFYAYKKTKLNHNKFLEDVYEYAKIEKQKPQKKKRVHY